MTKEMEKTGALNPIVDLSAIAEQLCRIEHKLDLVVEWLAMSDGRFPLRMLAEGNHRDPLTQEEVTYVMDLMKRHVVRRSADGTGLLPPAAVLFNPIGISPGNNPGNQGNSNGEP